MRIEAQNIVTGTNVHIYYYMLYVRMYILIACNYTGNLCSLSSLSICVVQRARQRRRETCGSSGMTSSPGQRAWLPRQQVNAVLCCLRNSYDMNERGMKVAMCVLSECVCVCVLFCVCYLNVCVFLVCVCCLNVCVCVLS